jgi:ribosomal protein L7/L12/sugar lactone lactonase YvrE
MCAAPLEYDGVSVTARCTYCTNTVIVPDEWRAGRAAPAYGQAGNLGDVVNQAMQLAEVAKLVQSGQKIEAIKRYRQLTGAGLAEAKDAVERLERGEGLSIQHTSIGGMTGASNDEQRNAAVTEVKRLLREGNKIAAIKVFREAFGVGLKEAKDAVEDLETGRPIAFMQTASGPQIYRVGAAVAEVGKVAAPAAKGCGVGVVLLAIVIGTALTFAAFFALRAYKSGSSLVLPGSGAGPAKPTFATEVASFGEEGIGAGQFKDARSIAADKDGRIYVAEYQGGRIQVFDRDGNFLRQWSADPKAVLLSLAVGRDGTVYVTHPSRIVKYDSEGEERGEVPNLNGNTKEYYSAAAVGLDNTIYAVGSNSNIIKITPSGRVSTVVNTYQQAGEDTDLKQIAVDGAGNVYGLDSRENTVLKFGPSGRFVTRFGGNGAGEDQLSNPTALAVDGKGRVFVADLGRGIQVFDANGKRIAVAGPERGVLFGIAFTSANELVVTARNDHKIIKYRVEK